MPDRRAGPNQGPYVGKQPRTRNQDGSWRAKRSDAGGSRGKDNAGCPLNLLVGMVLIGALVFVVQRIH